VPCILLPAGGFRPDASQYWLDTAHQDSLSRSQVNMSREYVYASPLPRVMIGWPARVIPTLVILTDPIGSIRDSDALSKIAARETGG
jgi:hypothetical protein